MGAQFDRTARTGSGTPLYGHCAMPARHCAVSRHADQVWPCHGPGLRPTAWHMGQFSVPCCPWATAIFAVSCQSVARQPTSPTSATHEEDEQEHGLGVRQIRNLKIQEDEQAQCHRSPVLEKRPGSQHPSKERDSYR